MKLVVIADSDSMSQAMLHDMRGSYIRHERPGFQHDASPSYREVAFFAACLGVFAALLYLRLRWGLVIRLDEAVALFAP